MASTCLHCRESPFKELLWITEDRVSTECENLKQEVLQLRTSHEKDMTSMRETLSKIKEERKKGLYILTTDVPELAYLLNCVRVEFSRTKYNARYVHINTEGELTNRVLANTLLPDSANRLEKYKGTSSTVPLQLSRSTQYFEVKVKLKIEEPLKRNNLLLEIRLTRKEEQDQSHRIAGRPHSYSLTVEHCSRHSSMCRKVRRHTEPLCLPDALKNITGTSATLHFGVVYESVRGRMAFLDVKNDEFIGKIDNVDSSVALWPMFGVYNPSQIIVRMSLVVGSDIEITDRKKTLVLECFS